MKIRLGRRIKPALRRFVKPLCDRPGFFSCRDQRRFIHDLSRLQFPGRFGFRADTPGHDHDVIIGRLIDYHHRIRSEAATDGRRGGDDMWREISKGHAAFEDALEARDATRVSEMLLNVCQSPLAVGFENGGGAPAWNSYLALNAIDKFLALAEALGCLPVQCPEQGEWGYESIDLDDLRRRVQARVPFDMAPPQAGGAFGIRFDDGILSERNLQAIHTALQAIDVLAGSDRRVVCEIGGGIGSLTLYLARAGMDEVCLYDLPTVSVVQGWYLLTNLGVDAVHLHGEPPRSARVRVLPFWQFDHARDDHFTLVVNQDSLPEIDAAIALHYLRLIARKTTGYFLHVNQEGRGMNADGRRQSVVPELVEQAGHFRRLRRCRDWMREGYVAETYRIEKNGPS